MATQTDDSDRPRRSVPESLRLRALSAALTASDLQQSIRWYRDVVGFTVNRSWEQDGKVVAVALVAGDVRLDLSQDDGAGSRDGAKGRDFRLYVSTVQNVDQIAARIRERGGTLESEPADTPWGARAFSLVDPDGFKLTISSVG